MRFVVHTKDAMPQMFMSEDVEDTGISVVMKDPMVWSEISGRYLHMADAEVMAIPLTNVSSIRITRVKEDE